jgi:hypothetical protein
MIFASTPQPDPATVRDALRRITSSTFVPAGSVSATILTHVVERTLAGDERTIKAYTIAVEGLGRSPDFNPDRDSTVRVAAMRLRNALDLYYAGPGARDPLRIRMAPGSYRPIFELMAPTAAGGDPTEPGRPKVAPVPAASVVRPRRAAFTGSARWLIAISAILAVDVMLTVVLMAAQMRGVTSGREAPLTPGQEQVRAAEKVASADQIFAQIHERVRRSYRQAGTCLSRANGEAGQSGFVVQAGPG